MFNNFTKVNISGPLLSDYTCEAKWLKAGEVGEPSFYM